MLVLAGAALVPAALNTKFGRYLLGIAIVRVVNEGGAPARNIRFVYSEDSSTLRRTRECGDLAPGQSREYWFHTKTLSGDEISYDFAGELRRAEMIKTVFAGDIFELRILPGGRVQPFNTR